MNKEEFATRLENFKEDKTVEELEKLIQRTTDCMHKRKNEVYDWKRTISAINEEIEILENCIQMDEKDIAWYTMRKERLESKHD